MEDRINWLKDNLSFGNLIKAIFIVQVFVRSNFIRDMTIHIVQLFQDQRFLPLISVWYLRFSLDINFWHKFLRILFVFKNIDDCPLTIALFLRFFWGAVTRASAFFTNPTPTDTFFLILEFLGFCFTPFDINLDWWVRFLDILFDFSRFYWLFRWFDRNLRMSALNAFISISSFPIFIWSVLSPTNFPHRLYGNWCTFTSWVVLLNFNLNHHFAIFLIFYNLPLILLFFWGIRFFHRFFFFYLKVGFVSLIACLFC